MNSFNEKIDLDVVWRELPDIINDLNLHIGDEIELNNEIFKLQTLQNRLEEFKKVIQEELGFEAFKNGALGIIPYLGMGVGLLIPGGIFADVFIGAGLKAIADNFSDRDKEISLQDVIKKLEAWINWSNFFSELAQEMLDNPEFLKAVHHQKKFLSISQQLEQSSDNFNIVLKLDCLKSLKQQIKQIQRELERLHKLKKQLKNIFTIESQLEKDNEDSDPLLVDIIISILPLFGNKYFTLDWIVENNDLVFSSEKKIKTLDEIFENCRDIKIHTENLFFKANNLIFQAQQSIARLEEQEKIKKEEESKSEVSRPVEQVHNIKSTKRENLKIIYLIVILSLGILTGIFTLNNLKNSTPSNTQTINKQLSHSQ